MLLKSEYPQTIYWRTFKHDDVFHLVGLHDGNLPSGAELDLHEMDVSFQLEIKVGNLGPFGVQLLPAGLGLQYKNTDRGLVVRADGEVKPL